MERKGKEWHDVTDLTTVTTCSWERRKDWIPFARRGSVSHSGVGVEKF